MTVKPVFHLVLACATLLFVHSTIAAPSNNTPRPKPRYGTAKSVNPAVQQRNQAYAANSAKIVAGKDGVHRNPKRADHYAAQTRAEFQKQHPVRSNQVKRPDNQRRAPPASGGN